MPSSNKLLTKNYLLLPALAWLVYVCAYLGRLNLSITIPYLEHQLGYSKATLGFLASGFFVAYAAGQLINGILGDRVGARNFISLGLLAAGISNVSVSLFHSFPLMLLSWSANGYFQSMLWGPLLKTITEAVPENKQYRAMFLMSTSPVIGLLLSYVLAGWLSVSYGWEIAFRIPGVLLLTMAVLWYWGISGFHGKQEAAPAKLNFSFRLSSIPGKKLVQFIVQKKLYVVILLGILVGIVKEGLTLWIPAIFTDLYFSDATKMLFVISLMPLVNLLFVILGGILYKKFNSNEQHVILLFLIAAVLFALLMWQVRSVFLWLNVLFFYGLMASLYATNNLITCYVPIKFSQDGRVSGAAGIVDCSFYAGAAIAAPVIGAAAENFGWNGIFGGILGICIIAALISGFRRTR